MVETVLNKKPSELIVERIKPHFKRITGREYWISVVYFQPENGYNFFFYIKRRGTYMRSIPLVRLPDSDLNELVNILKRVRKTYQFSFRYVNFTRQERRILYEEVER